MHLVGINKESVFKLYSNHLVQNMRPQRAKTDWILTHSVLSDRSTGGVKIQLDLFRKVIITL